MGITYCRTDDRDGGVTRVALMRYGGREWGDRACGKEVCGERGWERPIAELLGQAVIIKRPRVLGDYFGLKAVGSVDETRETTRHQG